MPASAPLRSPLAQRWKLSSGNGPARPFVNHGPTRRLSLELNPVKEPLDVARDCIRGHDKRRIKRIDVFARHRTFGVTHQRAIVTSVKPRSMDAERYRSVASGGLSRNVDRDLTEVYGHHHPDYLADAVEQMTAELKRRSTATAMPQKRSERTRTNVLKMPAK